MATELSFDRSRSPRSPKHSLQECLQYAKSIYDAVHRSPISSILAFELMGFQGKSGASSTALGSVRQFGLIDGTGEKTRISDLALTILEPESAEERSDAIIEAAQKPDVFQAIKTRFNDRIPSTDEPVRAFLIRELHFTKGGSDETIRSLRATEQFVATATPPREQLIPAETTHFVENGLSKAESLLIPVQNQVPNSVAMTSPHDVMRVALTKECFAELRFSGEITERAIANLKKYIDLMGSVWAEDEM